MKAKMRKPNPPKESSPCLGGKAGHFISPDVADKLLEKGYEIVTHRELSKTVLLAFGAKANDTLSKIDLTGEVHVRFGETTTLFPCDLIANRHPIWLIVECFKDGRVFRVRDTWLWNRACPSEAKFMTRIRGGKLVVNGFLHDKTEKLNLQEGSVFSSRVNAIMRNLPPVDIGAYVLTGKCTGYADVILAQERANAAPRSLITFQRILLGLVALLQKLRDPEVPLLTIAACVALGCAHLAAKVSGAAMGKRKSSFQSSALAPALSASVEEADPPVGAVSPLI